MQVKANYVEVTAAIPFTATVTFTGRLVTRTFTGDYTVDRIFYDGITLSDITPTDDDCDFNRDWPCGRLFDRLGE